MKWEQTGTSASQELDRGMKSRFPAQKDRQVVDEQGIRGQTSKEETTTKGQANC